MYDSYLSEYAAMAFEYGYSVERADALVLWEAQFGDFANGAQSVVDEFISSAEQKWAQQSSVVLLLPHGYEGQGPDHSSARIERYLQMCAQDNMTVARPSTPASYFHLLRRQAYARPRRPLIVFTPKAMLRLRGATSPVEDILTGRFEPVLDDDRGLDKSAVKRVLLHSGKIHWDLRAELDKNPNPEIALVRLEQYYPAPIDELNAVIDSYPNAQLFWVQDEPENQGAWPFIALEVVKHLHGRTIKRISRTSAASTATGSPKVHAFEQADDHEEGADPVAETSLGAPASVSIPAAALRARPPHDRHDDGRDGEARGRQERADGEHEHPRAQHRRDHGHPPPEGAAPQQPDGGDHADRVDRDHAARVDEDERRQVEARQQHEAEVDEDDHAGERERAARDAAGLRRRLRTSAADRG